MYESIVRRRGVLCGLLVLAIGACFVGQTRANPAAPKDAREPAARRSWSFLTDTDPGEPINAGAAVAFLTLGSNQGDGYSVDGAEGLDELGAITRVQFGPEHPFDAGATANDADAGEWKVATRMAAASATLITADGDLIFTWGFRSTATFTPLDELNGNPVTVNLFRPMGVVATPMEAESAVAEIATRLPDLLESTTTQDPGPVTWLTPTGGWGAYSQCLQTCTSAAYQVLYDRLLLCLQIAGVLTAGFSAFCHVICGFVAIPCILACLGVVLPAGSSAAAACVTAYAAALPLVAIACAIFCW